MAGFFQKFVAGAAEKQAEISTNQIQQQGRMDLEAQRAEIDAMRQKRREEFQSGENQKSRDQNQAQFEANQEARDADRKARAAMDKDKMDMLRSEHEKSIMVLDQKIESSKMDLEKKRKLESLRDKLRNTNPGDLKSRAKIWSELESYGIKPAKSEDEIFKLSDVTGEESLVAYDADTKTASKIDVGGATKKGGPKAGDVEDGWEFKGGDPGDAKNWVKL